MFFVVKPDITFKRKKFVSERVSPEQKKLMDDFEIFNYLKSERSKPMSLHITSLGSSGQISTSRNLKTPTQIATTRNTDRKLSEKKQSKRNNFFKLKLERYQKEFKEIQDKRKNEIIEKCQNQLKKDMNDIQLLTDKGIKEFQDKCSLYRKYYSNELTIPERKYRSEDMNLPLKKYSFVENQNKFRSLLKFTPAQLPDFIPQEEFETFKCNPDNANSLTNQIKGYNNKLSKQQNQQEQQLFDAIINKDEFTINQLLKENQTLVNSRNRVQETPLHVASKRNLKNIVELLLKYQADETIKDLWGQTPRQVAFRLRHQDLLKILSYK